MFAPHMNDFGTVLPWEYLPAAAGTYQAGQLLNTANGQLAALSAASTTTPKYLCMADVTAEAGELIPVTRIQKSSIYETTLSAEDADCAIGTKLEVSKGGLEVDGAAAGTFEAVYVDGTTAGSMIRGRFV